MPVSKTQRHLNLPKVVRTHHPLVAKGRAFPFEVSVACWVDLLGYGNMIAESKFNPLHSKSKEAIQRLHAFHNIVAESSHRRFPTLVLNDGAIAYRDLSMRSRSVTHDFLARCWKLFQRISEMEREKGLPGARMVLSTGFRIRNARRAPSMSHVESILKRLQEQKLSTEQAIREAASVRLSFDIVPELQSNFAFTKAYVADSDGTSGGLSGANFFVDLALFNDPSPPWLDFGPPIRWTNGRLRLQADFSPLRDIKRWKHPGGGPIEIRDGLQIAQHLAGDPDVLRALRSAN